ncbi:MAG: BMP family ABC transporter substrate-binding protein [Anaerolineales bacterium]|nr:BMP family ABC transporter substrate-binding protein [Anaerolineales bacterium]
MSPPLKPVRSEQNHPSRSRFWRDLLVVVALAAALYACAAPGPAPPTVTTAPPTPAVIVHTPTGVAAPETPVPAPSPTTPAIARTLVFFTETADNTVGFEPLSKFAQKQGWQFRPAGAREAQSILAEAPVAVVSVSAELSPQQWITLAQQHPETYFAIFGPPEAGAEIPANLLFLGGPAGREDQAGFLAGVTAGLTTKTQKVGVFSDTTTPSGLKYRNGFAAGVRYACPRCSLYVIELSTFSEVVFAQAIGQKYAALGADVVFAAAGDAGAFALAGAAQNRAWVIADDSISSISLDRLRDSERLLTRVSLDVFAAFESALADFIAGRPRSGVAPLSLANGGVVLAPIREGVLAPLDLQNINSIKQKLAEGALETGVDPLTGEEK